MFQEVRGFLGYAWALVLFPVMLGTFIGNGFFAKRLVTATGLTVSPRMTGGEVVRIIEHPLYQTLIHRPVFDGLFMERSSGFVQIDWKATTGALPERIEDSIDYDRDGRSDLQMIMDTSTDRVRLTPLNPKVIRIEKIYKLENERSVRIGLKK